MTPGFCELCRWQMFKVSVEGWDGRLACNCEHEYHYACIACVTEWGLTVSLGKGTIDPCIDNVRTGQAIAGDEPRKTTFGFPIVDLDGTLADAKDSSELVKWRNQVMGPQGVVEVLATPEGERVGNPTLAGLTKEKQDALEKDLRDALVEQARKDVDEAFLKQAVADAEVRKAEAEAKRQQMGDL